MALAQGFIVKSRPMREVLLEFGASPDRIIISPSGADGTCLLMLPLRRRRPRCCLSGGWWKRRALWTL